MERLDIKWDAFKYYHDDETDSFEDMCRSLFKAAFLDEGTIMQAPPTLAGIEVLPILERDPRDGTSRKRISFQAKFTKDAAGAYPQFKESAETTVSHFAGELDRVYIFNNNDLSTGSKSYKEIEAILAVAGIEAVPISGRVLLDMAAEHPDIAGRFFPYLTERYISGTPYNQSESEDQGVLFVEHPIRKLAEGLWVNWKTGALAESAQEALAGIVYEDGSFSVSPDNSGLPVVLSKGQLRLLSILVQGEGAVVSWKELCHRGLFMHGEIEYNRDYEINDLLGQTFGDEQVRRMETVDSSGKRDSDRKSDEYRLREMRDALNQPPEEGILPLTDQLQCTCETVCEYLISACAQIQSNTLYWNAKEDSRSMQVRDILRNRTLIIRDHPLYGHAPNSDNPGEIDLMVMKNATDPLTFIEAMNIDSVKTGYIQEHLHKLLDDYNPSGLPELFLVAYVQKPKRNFPKFWESYRSYIEKTDAGDFKVAGIQDFELQQHYIKHALVHYECGGAKFAVHHICMRAGD